ncbi:MAG TPA: SDR family NAD(P)-dependent oxidoreductase, partial [Steroidobacteraceae bacterium]
MAKKRSIPVPAGTRPVAEDRRRFLEGVAFSAGAFALMSGIGIGSRSARAQFTPPAAPTAPQPPPLKDVAGKTAYITAASDGIGLGIARACSNAGMKVVIGYRNDKRLAEALPLFKPDNAGVHAIKHDVTDRDGWVKLLEEIKGKFGKLHLLVNNAGSKTL